MVHGSVLQNLETALNGILLFAAFTSVGLTVNAADMASIWQTPLFAPKSPSRALVLGIVGLYACNPLVAGLVISARQATPGLATGLMIVAIMPGGPGSAIYSVAVGGFTSLNVTMTLISSVLATVAVPLLYKVAVAGNHADVHVKFDFFKVVLTSFSVIVPLAFGAWLSNRTPTWRRTMEGIMVPIVIIVIVYLMISRAVNAMTSERIICAGLMSLGGVVAGCLLGLAGSLGFRSSVSLSFELLIRDMPLVIAIVRTAFSENEDFRDVCGMMSHIVALASVATCIVLQRCGLIPPKTDDSACVEETQGTQARRKSEPSSLGDAQASSAYGSL